MDTISYNRFIFSDEKKYRIGRHLLFWFFAGTYFGLVREFNPRYYMDNGHFPNLGLTMAQAFVRLLPQTLLVYPLLYFIMPRYAFNGKFIKTWLFIIALVLITIVINAVFLMTIPWYEVVWLESKDSLLSKEPTLPGKFSMACLLALMGSSAAAGLAICFKMFKDHYVKNIRNQQLLKENIEAQLQLLRAQVHPHFLFNTLNNIYSQTQLESARGSKMIMGLSDMLRYILYEGQKPFVPLKQELMMICEYINLEKIRYGNKLDVHLLIPDKTDDIYIAPLILLPFVENCFKHGTSNMLENPWMNLTIELKEITLVMKLMNGKAARTDSGRNKAGIGINNVRQRLQLLYEDRHNLQINEDEEVFVVDLRIELVKIENKERTNMISQPQLIVEHV